MSRNNKCKKLMWILFFIKWYNKLGLKLGSKKMIYDRIGLTI